MAPTQCQLSSVNAVLKYFRNIHFNIIFPLSLVFRVVSSVKDFQSKLCTRFFASPLCVLYVSFFLFLYFSKIFTDIR